MKTNSPLPQNKLTSHIFGKNATLAWGIIFIWVAVIYMVLVAPAISQSCPTTPKTSAQDTITVDTTRIKTKLEAQINKSLNKYLSLTPKKGYLVINTTDNTFKLYKNRKLLREGICSTGSMTKLFNEEKSWLFKTPKGTRTIQSKITNPVWTKPDWAFVEEGLPVPPSGHPSRYEHGVLGDYALGMGSGYLIHGTLYQRLMGQAVTHGCIRLMDDDLKAVYDNLEIGSKVYIY